MLVIPYFDSLFLPQRSDQYKKNLWQRNREHWKEKKQKAKRVKKKKKRMEECSAFLRMHYFSKMDYTIYDCLR